MLDLHNFQPGAYLTIATTTTAVSGTIAGLASATGGTSSMPLQDVRVYNAGTSVAFLSWGAGVVATATTALAIPPSSVPEKFCAPGNGGLFSAIAALGTGSVYVTLGNGS